MVSFDEKRNSLPVDTHVAAISKDAAHGRPIGRVEAPRLLSLPEDSLEAALLRATADCREMLAAAGFAHLAGGQRLGQTGPAGEPHALMSFDIRIG